MLFLPSSMRQVLLPHSRITRISLFLKIDKKIIAFAYNMGYYPTHEYEKTPSINCLSFFSFSVDRLCNAHNPGENGASPRWRAVSGIRKRERQHGGWTRR